MTTTTDQWKELHDATLDSIELRWSSGEAIVKLRTEQGSCSVVGSGVRRLACDRQLPWGFSVSINEIRGPSADGAGVFVLEIEVQSGDVVRIEADAFRLLREPT